MNPSSSPSPFNRRQFLASAGTATLAASTLAPGLLIGADAGPRIRFGLVGCGGRGTWIAKLFLRHGGFECVAVHDYFQDRADRAASELDVPASARFTGLKGYQRLLQQSLDAVVIQSPPFFHTEHATAAVAASKHVYLAKPVAVDVPGCLAVREAGREATNSHRAFLIDFQTRATPDYQTAIQRVHQGMIGKIGLAEATYHCGNTFDGPNEALRADPHNPEVRLRAWGLDKALSGDVITEQNIHALDVASWVLDAEPLKAYGTCTDTRGFAGTCHDTWSVIFYYPNNILCSFNSKQFGHGYDDILCRVYGTNGTLDTHYGGAVTIKARDDGFRGSSPNIYEAGAVSNIAAFHQAIQTGDCTNPTVAPSVRSNLVTLLGRTAAYRHSEVTWDDMIQARQRVEFDLGTLHA